MKPVLIAAALLLTLAACGSSGGSEASGVTTSSPTSTTAPASTSSSTKPATPTASTAGEAELKAAVQAYSDAYLTGDASGGYALLSARCQKRVSKAEFIALVGQAKQQFGEALPFKSFDAEINGPQARITYTYSVASINQDQEPWALEDGSWREDDC
jgi:hypothetical protein